MPTLIVRDPKGISLGTWNRGETVMIPPGGRIEVNTLGQSRFDGKLLSLTPEARERLIVGRRLDREA